MRIRKGLKRALVTVLVGAMLLQQPNLSALAVDGNGGQTVSGSDSYEYEVPVDGLEYTDDLSNLVDEVEIKDENGDDVSDTLERGENYYLEITFTEQTALQLKHTDNLVIYTFSEGFNAVALKDNDPTIIINVKDKDDTYKQIKLTLGVTQNAEGQYQLTVSFDKSSDFYELLTGAGDVTFTVGMNLALDEDFAGNEVDFGNGHKYFVVDQKDKVDISGGKTWNDNNNQDGKRPNSISVTLYADGVATKTIEVTAATNWQFSFGNLPKFNDNGTEIFYTVGEASVDGYTSEVNGLSLTNTHVPEVININGNKAWNDNNDQDGKRPDSITVYLLANGEETGISKVVTPDANGNWNYSFEGVPKYKDGAEITYTVQEGEVEGYTSTPSGHSLINTHAPEKVTISGSKNWDDENDADGIRPSSISVQLYADGVLKATTTVTPDTSGNWNYSFGELPKYENGREIVYTVAEVPVKGYTSQVSGTTITNVRDTEVENLLKVEKIGSVGEDGVVTYQIQITSVGINNNVTITDALVNNAYVILNKDVTASSSTGNAVNGSVAYNGQGFTYTVPQMQDGEVITLTYTAEVDYIALGNNTIISENDVTVKSDEDEVEDSLLLTIEPSDEEPITKTDSGAIGSGKDTEVTWTITVNDNNWMNMAGQTISDTITADLANVLEMAGTGITIEVKDENGQSLPSRTIPWADLNVTKNEDNTQLTWTYNVPPTDGKYSYVITYKTKVNMDEAIADVYLKNTATLANKYSATSDETIVQDDENKIPAVEKKAIKVYKDGQTTKVDWSITVTVPAQGLDVCQILEQAPELSQNYTLYMDKLDTTKLTVTGLMPNESYYCEWLSHDWAADGENMKLQLVFYKDQAKTNPGLNGSINGMKRDVTINITTIVDEKWIEDASVTGAWSGLAEHTNNVRLTANDKNYNDSDKVIVIDTDDKYMSKGTDNVTFSGTTTIGGVEYPYYQFSILLKGVTTDEIIVYDQIAPLSMDNWALYEGPNPYFTYNNALKIVASDETSGFYYGTDEGGITATMPTNSSEKLKFVVDVPKKADDSFYNYYQITYTLIPKDEEALNKLKDLTLNCENGTLKITNTATWENMEAPYNVEYTYDAVSKETLKTATVGDYDVTYQISVNPGGIQMNGGKDLEIIDTMSSSLVLKPETMVVTADGVELKAGEYSYSVENNVMTMRVPDGKAILVTYDVRVVGTNGEEVTYTNSVKVGSAEDGDEESGTVIMDASGSGGGGWYVVNLLKLDAADNTKGLAGAVFELEEKSENTNWEWKTVVDNSGLPALITTEADKAVAIEGHSTNLGWWLYEGIQYRLKEVKAPAGYDLPANPYTEFIIKATPIAIGEYKNGDTITITNTAGVTHVSGSKTWDDDGNRDGKRPASITINLLQNGVAYGEPKVVTEADSWSWTFDNLPKYDASGNEYIYTITEDAVAGYDTIPNGYDLTNKYTPEKTKVSVTKVWDDADDLDKLRPGSVTVQLYAGNVAVDGPVPLSDANNWTYEWKDLPKNAAGTPIDYTVVETAVNGYTSSQNVVTTISGKEITITNTHTPSLTSVSGKKVWDDANNQDGKRPDSITVNLLKNGVKVDSVEVSEATNWEFAFTNLPTMEGNVALTYTIEEVDVPTGYTATADPAWGESVNGKTVTITNTYTPETLNFHGSKVWSDADDQDGLRPNSITVILNKNGNEYDRVTVTETNNWQWSFNDLPKYEGGSVINWTVEEILVEGYASGQNETATNDGKAVTITNTHIPEVVSIGGIKTWEDANNQDGKRPTEITVRLYADDIEVDYRVVSEATGWAYDFGNNWPKYANGKEIVYEVWEDKVDGYAPTYTNYDIINTYTPGKTFVTVTKIWDDDNDRDKLRPASIEVQLYADNTASGAPVVLDEANNWTYTWTGLDEYVNGKKIEYSVDEVSVPTGYTKEDPVYDVAEGWKITNTHKSEETQVSVTKVWDDADDQDGIRPNYIKVQLYAGTTAYGKAELLNANNNWSFEWTNLPKNEAGVPIAYTVKEVEVPNGYTTPDQPAGNMADGFTITNTHVPSTTEVKVTKVWDDKQDQDGIRPDDIKVQLYADNTASGAPVVLNEANGWTYTWTGLAEYADGKQIEYSVQEVSVPDGYISEEPVYSDTEGWKITNTHTPAKTDIKVTKVWEDEGNQDGIRPDSIKVQLYAGDAKVGEVVVLDASNNWTYAWKDLDVCANGNKIAYRVDEVEVPTGYIKEITNTNETSYVITNTHEPAVTQIQVTKVWDDENDYDGFRPDSIKVQLYADGTASGEAVVLNEANGWKYTWTGLAQKKAGEDIVYTVDELEVPEGYVKEGPAYDAEKGFVITNKHVPGKTSLAVNKVWNDADDQDGLRPDSIKVQLYADDVALGAEVTLNASNNWTYTWTDLDLYEDGKEITYTVDELEVPLGYEKNITKNNTTSYTITNTHEILKTEIKVTKAWDDADDQDGLRPESVSVQLYADDVAIGNAVVLDASGSWTYTWTDLAKYAAGKEIKYTVEEVEVPNGYTKVISGDAATGYTITNTHEPAITQVSVVKVWDDANNQDGLREDSVKVQLYADTVKVGNVVELDASNSWKYTWSDLAKYAAGEEIKYTVEEVEVPDGYTAKVTGDAATGYTITNTHIPEKLNIHGSKVWVDGDNQDGLRPESITINLLKGGVVVDSIVVTAENGWKWSFTNLDKYSAGELIEWSVTEESVPGYTTNYKPEATKDGKEVTITNTHVPEVTSVSGSKIWKDADDQDGKRPESITIHLLANGKTVDTITVSEAENWKYEFTNLPKYENGKEIIYTVTEDAIGDYSTEIDGYDVTNSYTPGKTSVTVIKEWDDANNQDGLRPDSIEVQLYANGVSGGDSVVLNETNGWSYTWKELDMYEDGKLIEYTVKEVKVPLGYEMNLTGDAILGYTITNKHEPLTTQVQVSKVWDDADNQDGLRPGSIRVQLYADGKVCGDSVLLNEANGWNYEWTKLAKKNAGVDIVYTVKEVEVPGGYQTSVSSGDAEYVITNTHTPEVISVSGSKIWKDDNNSANTRPESITIHLLADGNIVASKTVTEADNWSWTFDNLPKYADGMEIVYTIIEDAVEGYSTKIDGYDVTNVFPAEIPEYGSLKITKKLLMDNMAINATDATFYVALYADNSGQKLLSEVKAIEFKDASSSVVEFTNLEVGKTYYVRECDAEGNPLSSGTTEDGVIYVAEFKDGDNDVSLNEENEEAVIELSNRFEEVPDNYYVDGKLTITKKVVDSDANAKSSSEVFYAGIFADAAYTELSELVSENIVKLSMNGASQVAVDVDVTIMGESLTLYIAEVDENGKPVDEASFAYEVTVEPDEVTLDIKDTEVEVVIINQEKEETPEPTDTPKPTDTPTPTDTPEPTQTPTPTQTPNPTQPPSPTQTPSPTGAPTQTPPPTEEPTSPKTGDETMYGEYAFLLVMTYMFMGIGVMWIYRKDKKRMK